METTKAVYRMIESELTRQLFAEAADLVYVYDVQGNILFLNKQFEHLTGSSQEAFYGRPFSSLFNEAHLDTARSAYTKTLQGEQGQCEMYFKNTETLYEHKTFPLRDYKRNIIGVMGIARDITASRQREEGLMSLHVFMEKCMVEHADKLREVNEELVEEIDCRLRLEKEFKQTVEKQQKSMKGLLQTMALAIESNDHYAVGHQARVARLARHIAGEMRLSKDRIDNIGMAAAIHDIGKVSVPPRVFNKTEPLTEREFAMLRAHARAGHDIVQQIELPYPVAAIILQHHERIDGTGYPLKLQGKDILLESKILAVSDVVEAMSSPRPRRQNAGIEIALHEISKNSGILYDFNVVHACLTVFNEHGFRFDQEPQVTQI